MKLNQIEPIIESFFRDNDLNSDVVNFLQRSEYSEKWVLYSDYCLDDKTKPNNVLSFALMPFLSEEQYNIIDASISSTQPSDIKKTKIINPEFLNLLKQIPVFSYSFILNERKLIFGDSHQERINSVIDYLEAIKHNYESWSENAEDDELKKDYASIVHKLNNQIIKITQKKEIKLMSDIILISFLGAMYASKILRLIPNLDIVGWFPDRDSSNEAHENIITPIFTTILYNRINNRNTRWAFVPSDTTTTPFYDNENRIVDVICGTIADYDFDNNIVSKDKFSTVLEGLFANNPYVKIYRIKAESNPLTIGSISIEKQ